VQGVVYKPGRRGDMQGGVWPQCCGVILEFIFVIPSQRFGTSWPEGTIIAHHNKQNMHQSVYVS